MVTKIIISQKFTPNGALFIHERVLKSLEFFPELKVLESLRIDLIRDGQLPNLKLGLDREV